MNERIRDLAEQAYTHARQYIDDEVQSQFEQKFAELIVRECRLAVNRIDVESPEASIALTMADAAIRDCFGVK